MIQKLRRLLGIESHEETLRAFALVVEQSELLKAEIDVMAREYLNSSKELGNWLSGEKSSEVQSLIKSQRNGLTSRYLTFLASRQKEYKRLEELKKGYITKHPDFEKALSDLKKSDFIDETLSKYRDRLMSLAECDTIIKAATKNKVCYSDNIVFNQKGEILLVQRGPLDNNGPNLWVLPGGHCEMGEDHKIAACRELLEETGYQGEDCYQVGEFEDDKVHIEYYTTMVDTDEQSPVVDAEETRATQFIPIKDLYNYPTLYTNMWDNVYKILGIEENIVKIKKAIAHGIVKSNTAGMLADNAIDSLVKGCGGDNVKEKFHKVMKKWKSGTLHSGDKKGEKVTSQKQAIAIALAETGQSNKEKAVEGELEKSRAGVYENTEENRKLGRVGQKYGSDKSERTGEKGFLHTKEFFGVNFHTNQDREYTGKKVSPWDSKGSERGMTKDDMEAIAFDSADGGELEKHLIIKPEDSLKDICEKLKKRGITNVEIYSDKASRTYKMRALDEGKSDMDEDDSPVPVVSKKFKKGDMVRFKTEFRDKGDKFKYELKDDPDEGRVEVIAHVPNMRIKPTHVVSVDQLESFDKGVEEKLHGGKADNKSLDDIAKKHGVDIEHIQEQFKMGVGEEGEHSDDKAIREEIAKDHLWNDPDYYTKLKKVEKAEMSLFEKARALGHLVPKKVEIKGKTGQIHYGIRWVNPQTGEAEKYADVKDKNKVEASTFEETIEKIVASPMNKKDKCFSLINLGIYDPKLLILLTGETYPNRYLAQSDINIKELPDQSATVAAEVRKEQATNDTPEGRTTNKMLSRNPEDIQELWDTYKDNLQLVIEGVGGAKFALAYGSGGVGKTYTFTKLAKAMNLRKYDAEIQPNKDQYDYVVIKGRISPVQVYAEMYRHRDKLIVFDDCDSFLVTDDVQGFLKGGLDTGEDTQIDNKTGRNVYNIEGDKESGAIPNVFSFKGRVIAITNLTISDFKDKAVLTKALPINLSMTIDETLMMLEKIKNDIDIYSADKTTVVQVSQEARDLAFNMIKENKEQLGSFINTRTYYTAVVLANRGIQQGLTEDQIRKRIKMTFESTTGAFDEAIRGIKSK